MPKSKRPDLGRIAFIGTALPRKCGIATFGGDLADAISRCVPDTQVIVVPVNDIPEGYAYPDRVRFLAGRGGNPDAVGARRSDGG